MNIYTITLEAKGGARETRCIEAKDMETCLGIAKKASRVFTKVVEIRLSVDRTDHCDMCGIEQDKADMYLAMLDYKRGKMACSKCVMICGKCSDDKRLRNVSPVRARYYNENVGERFQR